MCHRLLFRPGTCNTGITFFAAYLAASPYLRNDCDLFNYNTKREGVWSDETSKFYLLPSLYTSLLYYYTRNIKSLIDLFIHIDGFILKSSTYN